jgi:hypothetical protein
MFAHLLCPAIVFPEKSSRKKYLSYSKKNFCDGIISSCLTQYLEHFEER